MGKHPDLLFGTWQQEFDKVWADLKRLTQLDDVFWQVQAIVDSNPKLTARSVFLEWLGLCYSAAVMVGLRRLTEDSPGVVSFVRLLHDMERHSEGVLTERRFLMLWGEGLEELAPLSFDRLGGEGKRCEFF